MTTMTTVTPDAVITLTIDPTQANFVSPSPGEATVPMGNFDPTVIDLTEPPTDPDITVTVDSPTSITIGATNGAQPCIEFLVKDSSGKDYYICGIVLDRTSGAGASLTGSKNFPNHQCSYGNLYLFYANVVQNANYNFYLLIQEPSTGDIALVDPKIVTGGS